MTDLRVLIVEDDSDQIQTWGMQIDRFNATHEYRFVPSYAETLLEARDLIFNKKFDAAIVDIRLRREGSPKDATHDGNDVRRMLLENELIVVAHVTGEPQASDMSDDNSLVKIFTKGEESEDSVHSHILKWLESMKEMIEILRESKAVIKKRMAFLFRSSIWPRWPHWKAERLDKEFVFTSLARHMSSHLHDDLLRDNDGKVHPEEWYFLPPSPDRLHTGDIIQIDCNLYILVSPRCDLSRLTEGSSLLFAKMLDISTEWSVKDRQLKECLEKCAGQLADLVIEEQAKIEKIERKRSSALSEFRQEFYGHKKNTARLHFLPQINDSQSLRGPFYVDFSQIINLQYFESDLYEKLSSRVASLAPEFVPALVQRLGAYISRIGSPDYSHFEG